MANGVEVIIKGNQVSPVLRFNGRLPQNVAEVGLIVTTLPPTTVSNQFHLLDHPTRPNTAIDHLLLSMARSATPDLLRRTMLTTFTYFQTIFENETTMVKSTEQVVSDVITEAAFLDQQFTVVPIIPLETSKVLQVTTETHLSTYTFSKTLYDLHGSHVKTQLETLTEFVVLPHFQTFYTTFTTFFTSLQGTDVVTVTSTSVTYNVITPTATASSEATALSSVVDPVRLQPMMIYATKTFYTTTTFLTSILGEQNETKIQSRTSVVSSVVTEAISTVLNGQYLLALESSYLADHPEIQPTATFQDPEIHSVTTRTIEGTYVPDVPYSQAYPHWPKGADEALIEPSDEFRSTVTVQQPNFQEIRSEINHLIQDLVGIESSTSVPDLVFPTVGSEEAFSQEPTPPLEISTTTVVVPLEIETNPDSGDEAIIVEAQDSTPVSPFPALVFGHLRHPVGEEQKIFNMISGESGSVGLKPQASPEYYDEAKEETAFKESYDPGETQNTVPPFQNETDTTSEATLETLQQELLDEIPTDTVPPATDSVVFKFTPDGKPFKVPTRRPALKTPEYDDLPDSEPIGNVYNLMLPRPPSSSTSADESDAEAAPVQGSDHDDDSSKDEEDSEELDDEQLRKPLLNDPHPPQSSFALAAPPPTPMAEVAVSQTGTSINWNPLLKLGALGLGGLGASALTKWSPLIGSMAGYLKTGLVPILARNDTHHEQPKRPQRPNGMYMEESASIPRRPVVTHANEPNFRYEKGPPQFATNFGPAPINMHVVLTPLGPQQHRGPPNMMKGSNGNHILQRPNGREPPRHEEPPPGRWTNQIILPFPSESNEVEPQDYSHQMVGSHEFVQMKPPPAPPYQKPTQHNKPIQAHQKPPNFQSFKPMDLPSPTPAIMHKHPQLHNFNQIPSFEQKSPLPTPFFQERRPLSPIPTSISHQIPRPSPTKTNEPKKVHQIPKPQQRPTLAQPTVPTEPKRLPNFQRPGQNPQFRPGIHSAEAHGQKLVQAQPQGPFRFSQEQKPMSLEFVPIPKNQNPQPTNQNLANQNFHPFKPNPNSQHQFVYGQESESGLANQNIPNPQPTIQNFPNQNIPNPQPTIQNFPNQNFHPFKPIPNSPAPFVYSHEFESGFPNPNPAPRPHLQNPFPPRLPLSHESPTSVQQYSWEDPQGGFLGVFKPGGSRNPFNPKPQYQLITESSEDVPHPQPPSRHPPFGQRPQNLIPFHSHPNYPPGTISSEEIPDLHPVQSQGPVPPSPQRFPYGGQGMYEIHPAANPPILLPGSQPHPYTPPTPLKPQVLLPSWNQAPPKPEAENIVPTPHFPPYKQRPNTVFIVEETYDPPPTTTTMPPPTQLIVKEIQRQPPTSPTTIATAPSTTNRRPMFIRRSSTTPLPRTTATPFSSSLFPQGFDFSSSLKGVLEPFRPKPTNKIPDSIENVSKIKGLHSDEEFSGTIQVTVKNPPDFNESLPLEEELLPSDDSMFNSEEKEILKNFKPENTAKESSVWWATTFRPTSSPFLPTTFRNHLRYTPSELATTFRPRRPPLSRAPNHVQQVPGPAKQLDSEGLDQVKLKNIEIHKTPGFIRHRQKFPEKNETHPVLAFISTSSEEENKIPLQNSFKPEEDESYETYEIDPPGYPAQRLTPPPPPQATNTEKRPPLLRRPPVPKPPGRPPSNFPSFPNIIRPPFQPPNNFAPPKQIPSKQIPKQHHQHWSNLRPVRPSHPDNIRGLEKQPGGQPPPSLIVPPKHFNNVNPIPLNPELKPKLPLVKPTGRFRLKTTTISTPKSSPVTEAPPASANQVKVNPAERQPLSQRPADLRPAADGDPFYESEEDENIYSPEFSYGNRPVGGPILNSLHRPIVPKEEMEPPPINSLHLHPPALELPSNGPIRTGLKPNLIRPKPNFLPSQPPPSSKPVLHTIATVDHDNKIIATNVIPAFPMSTSSVAVPPFPPINPTRPKIQHSPTSTQTETEKPLVIIGSVETVELHGSEVSNLPVTSSTTGTSSTTVKTTPPQKLPTKRLTTLKTFAQKATTVIEKLPEIKPTRAFVRFPPRPSLLPQRRRTSTAQPPAEGDQEQSTKRAASSTTFESPPPYKPLKPFMPITNPAAGMFVPPWKLRTSTTAPPPTSTEPPIVTPKTVPTTLAVPKSTTTETTSIRLDSSEEVLEAEESMEMMPTTFRPLIRPYFQTPLPPRENLTATTLITKEGPVVAIVKKYSTASSISTKLPKPIPTRYVTHSKTVTGTMVDTLTRIVPTTEGGLEPVTETVIVTRLYPPETVVSTILGTVTMVNTLQIQPTTMKTTIMSQFTKVPAPPPLQIDPTSTVIVVKPTSSGFTPTAFNETVKKVLHGGSGILVRKPSTSTTTNPPETISSDILTAKTPKQAEVPAQKSHSACNKTSCSTANQVCRGNGAAAKCGCKGGYARMRPTVPCRPTFTYELSASVKGMHRDEMKDATYSQAFLNSLSGALEAAFMSTDLRRQFQGTEVMKVKPISPSVYVDFLLHMTVNMTQDKIRAHLIRTLRNSNFSVGNLGQLSPEASADFTARDFNECHHLDYNDCSPSATCFNVPGSFTCDCNPGFKDKKKHRPGRDCVSLAGCSECNYKGNCYNDKRGRLSCDCFRWYGGPDCRWNLKILLMGVVCLGSLLLILVIICAVVTCRRKPRHGGGVIREQRPGSGRFMRYRSPTSQTTLERTAIMHDTASSTGSDDVPIQRSHQPHPSYTPDSLVDGFKNQRRTDNNLINFSMRTHEMSPMNVVIPRAKIRQSPNGGHGRSSSSELHVTPESSTGKFLNYLEGSRSKSTSLQPTTLQREKESKAFRKLSLQERRISTGALVSSGTEVSARGGMRRRSTGVEPEFHPKGTLSDIRSSRASCYSCKATSYSGYSESAGHTMAEKDGASTVYTVQGKLFRLTHDTDSNASSD